MIRVFLYLWLILCGVFGLHAQESRYETAMQKGFELWGEGKPDEASNMFERIATAEKENWLPSYYVAFVNITTSFSEKDLEKLSARLEKAKKHLEKAAALSPENEEIIILEAMMNTAWIVYDGATYGMTLSGKNTELYKKALQMAPENPRVVLSKADWDMGSAKFFGQDTSPYCKDVEKALQLFATFKNEIPFYPQWGKERAEEILQNCK